MSRAIGMIEFKTTPAGITAADAMVKTSEVEIVEAQTVCPGKYIAIITGDLSAVKAAVDTAVTTYEDKCIDSFVLGNPHESIFPAIYGTTQVEEISALGILETYDAASIIEAADQAAKTSEVEIVEAQTVCPGKYIAIITGDLSAVKAAVDTAVTTYEDKCIDSFVLGNPHESIFPAIYGTTQVEEISALGILETYDAASIIEAADQAAKTAIVDLIELRIAKGMCGKSYMLLTGEVSAVEASIERAKELVAEKGMYMDSSVIAHPDKRMIDTIL